MEAPGSLKQQLHLMLCALLVPIADGLEDLRMLLQHGRVWFARNAIAGQQTDADEAPHLEQQIVVRCREYGAVEGEVSFYRRVTVHLGASHGVKCILDRRDFLGGCPLRSEGRGTRLDHRAYLEQFAEELLVRHRIETPGQDQPVQKIPMYRWQYADSEPRPRFQEAFGRQRFHRFADHRSAGAESLAEVGFAGERVVYLPSRRLVGLTFLSAIERSVYTSKKPIKTLADIANLKLRVLQSPTYVAAFEAFGAQPTPMAYSEVYLALQNGVVDGAENSPDTFVMDRMVEVSKYLNMTKAHYMPSLLVMSKVRFDALSDEQKAIVEEAAKSAAQASISTFRKTYTESLEKVKEANVEIVETDRAEFAKAAHGAWPAIVAKTPDGEPNLKIIEEAKAK